MDFKKTILVAFLTHTDVTETAKNVVNHEVAQQVFESVH